MAAVSHVNAANAITSLSIASAVGAVLLAARGELLFAIVLGAVTLPCDVLDGVVARRRGTASPFGAQLDSLSDAIAFGVLPAVLGHALGLRGISSVVLVVYALGAVWRLARFHEGGLSVDARGRECFDGVPTTFAAAMFYVVAAVSAWLPDSAGQAVLLGFFLAGPVCMNLSFAFPKRGWHTRMLWVCVPVSLGALVLAPGLAV